jgi:hypothetical protein
VGARVAVVAVAAVALAWLGVMERDARLQAEGIAGASRLHAPGTFGRAEDDLRAARFLNPDATPDFARAVLYQGAGRPRQASALLERIVRREPDNLAAWGLIYAVTREREPEAARRALAAHRRLDPVNARRPR